MAIDYTIPGATPLDQRNEPTTDGLPDENANDNCVPASIAEGLRILTGRTFDGDQLKDAVYGQGWTGFQAASAYVAYCASQGVTLSPHNDTQWGLVSFIHTQVRAGNPVLVTMPSQWGTAPADPVHPVGSTHVGCAVGVGPGLIRVMNPWGGFWQDQPDDWWAARLCYGQVWTMQKAGGGVSGVPSGWSDDGTTLTAPNGVRVVRGFRAFILNNGWDAGNVPVGPEFSVGEVEQSNQTHGAGVIQFFRFSQLSWTASDGNVFLTWIGAEAAYLRSAVTSLQAQLQAASDHLATAQALVTSLQAQLAQAQATTSDGALVTALKTALGLK